MIAHFGELPQYDNMIRFVAISDTHNDFSFQVPNGDVLLHAGDWTRRGSIEEIRNFVQFLNSLPHPHKVLIPGNHELLFDDQQQQQIRQEFQEIAHQDAQEARQLIANLPVLIDSMVEVLGYKIFGSPWTLWKKRTMAFTANSETLQEKFNQIPLETEILLTHSPPFGILDPHPKYGQHGSLALLQRIQEVKPIASVFGHVHQGYGQLFLDDTLFVNAAIQNEPSLNSPIVFDLPRK